MKNTLVRLSVLTLAFAGFAASSVVSHSQSAAEHAASVNPIVQPMPICAPSDGTYCGMH